MYDNYENDPRVASELAGDFDAKKMTITINMEDDDGEEIPTVFPARYEVCHVCSGRGSHVNPAIDCDGLSSEDFADDPDFRDDYFSGRYDQTCNLCKGRTTVPEIDADGVDFDQEAYDRWCAHSEQVRVWDAESAAERRMGC